MKKTLSTYSRMFLVSPTVYEKLLNCIDEKDKKFTENLNTSKEKKIRPSDEYIQELNIESFNEPREVSADFIPETVLEEEETGTDQPESDIIYRDNPAEIQSELESTIPETSNQLSTPCITSEKGEVIPSGGLIYRPTIQKSNFKAVKEPIVSIPRLSKEQIDFHTKQQTTPNPQLHPRLQLKQPIISIPRLPISKQQVDFHTKKQNDFKPKKFVLKKPVLSIPRLSEQEILEKTNPAIIEKLPDLQQAQIEAFEKSTKNKEKLLVPSIIKKKKETTKIKNSQCPICMKFWRSKWDLRRHMSTVHSNFKSKQNIGEPEPLPDTDETMIEQTDDFPIWTRTRSQKRTSTDAKLPSLKSKFRPPGGEDEYESWNE